MSTYLYELVGVLVRADGVSGRTRRARRGASGRPVPGRGSPRRDLGVIPSRCPLSRPSPTPSTVRRRPPGEALSDGHLRRVKRKKEVQGFGLGKTEGTIESEDSFRKWRFHWTNRSWCPDRCCTLEVPTWVPLRPVWSWEPTVGCKTGDRRE